jgi:hypothetical protein
VRGPRPRKSERTDLTFYWVRPSIYRMLMPDERALLRRYCHEHPVATCPQCSQALTLEGLGTDIIIGRRDFCPACRTDLTGAVRLHFATCTVMRAQAREIRERAGDHGGLTIAPRSPETTGPNGTKRAAATHAHEEQARAPDVKPPTD